MYIHTSWAWHTPGEKCLKNLGRWAPIFQTNPTIYPIVIGTMMGQKSPTSHGVTDSRRAPSRHGMTRCRLSFRTFLQDVLRWPQINRSTGDFVNLCGWRGWFPFHQPDFSCVSYFSYHLVVFFRFTSRQGQSNQSYTIITTCYNHLVTPFGHRFAEGSPGPPARG